MTSSISRRLILWLAVPLMLLALCGALVHYFNNITPGVISSDRRLKDAANALMAHLRIKDGRISVDARSDTPPRLPGADSVIYAMRDTSGRLIDGDARLPAVPMSGETSQLIAMTQLEHRAVRTLTTRVDTPGGVVLMTVADIRPVADPAARYGFVSTLLWDFVQLDVTLVLVWVGIQLGLRPVKRLRDEIAARSPKDLRPIDESSVPREIAPVVVTLNRLFTTLRSSVQSQQQFIANTAHQLRTPITGLQAQLDLLVAESAAAPVQNRLLTLQRGHPPVGAFGQSAARSGPRRSRGEHRHQKTEGAPRRHRRRCCSALLRSRLEIRYRSRRRDDAGIGARRSLVARRSPEQSGRQCAQVHAGGRLRHHQRGRTATTSRILRWKTRARAFRKRNASACANDSIACPMPRVMAAV